MSIKKQIQARCPVRLDLAGGTVDIWPLFLLLKHPLTINLGIDLFAETQLTVDPSLQPGLRLRSQDQGKEMSLSWADLDLDQDQAAQVPPQLDLHFRMLKHYFQKVIADAKLKKDLQNAHVTLSTHARSPAGAGLGGSSALSISLIGAIDHWCQQDTDSITLIETVRDLEAQVIKVPTGLQDYYGAMFGGLQSIEWGVQSHSTQQWDASTVQQLEKKILLFYSGRSRNSGINNWVLFKDFLDQKSLVPKRFQDIADATLDLNQALKQKDWEAVGSAIRKDWDIRSSLAPGISTPEMDQAFLLCENQGIVSYNVCGAGGGGCFMIYSSDPQKLAKAQRDLLQQIKGLEHLPFKASGKGLSVSENSIA